MAPDSLAPAREYWVATGWPFLLRPAWRVTMKRLALRYGLLVLVLAAISGAILWLGGERPGAKIRPHPPAEAAITAREAKAQQQGVPTDYGEALADLDRKLVGAQTEAARQADSWLAVAAVGDVLLARGRLTNRYEDYRDAGRWFDKAAAINRRVGPFLQRAGWNFAVHRLGAMDADLKRVEAFTLPSDGSDAVATGLRGDIAFYSGDYDRARNLYEQSHEKLVTLGTAFRLANYWARMGDPARALAYIDEAESRVRGPQQQQRAFFETQRGLIAFAAGQWDGAGRHYARANAIFPGYWQIEEHLATILALKGDTARAMRLYRGIADRTGMPEAYDAVAGLYRAQGDLAQSQAWAARAKAGWATRLAVLPEAAYGHALDHELAFGTPARALAIARANYRNRPYADSATGLAWAWMANGNPREAIRAIEPALRSGWTAAEPYIVATEAYALAGEAGKADAARKRAIEINPHSFDRNPGVVWLEH